MATSGTYSFTVTTNDLVRESMLNIGKLGESEGPTSQEYTDIVRKLNMIVKQLQGAADFSKGVKMWTRRIGHLFLSNLIGQYNLGPTATGWTNSYVSTTVPYNAYTGATSIQVTSIVGMHVGDYIGIQTTSGDLFWTTIVAPLSGVTVNLNTALTSDIPMNGVIYTFTTKAQQPIVIDYVFLRDAQSQDTPIKIMDVLEYAMLPSKTDLTNQSDPSSVYIENQIGYSILNLDVGAAADVTKHVVVGYLESVQDVSGALTETLEYPQEYFRALSWMLAREICPMFNAEWTPLMAELCKESISIAQNKDPETSSLYFQCNE